MYVRLMVYAGLSLFIIRQANLCVVVCVFTRITLQHVRLKYLFSKFFSEWIPLIFFLLLSNHTWCVAFGGIIFGDIIFEIV